MSTRGRRVHAIEKSIQLLDCFWQERRPLALRELEAMTGWAKSTIHGLLASMLDSGVIEQNATDGNYRLGYHLFELGSAVNQSWGVPEISAPYLQRIVDQEGESAYLARLSGDELILTLCEEPHVGFRIVSEVGTRLPLHCTSQGKVILANLPRYDAQRLLNRHPLTACTPKTQTDPARLLAEIARCRSIAEEHEEYRAGLQSVAAPIFDAHGVCHYAIGIICMTSTEPERFERLRTAVSSAAAAITAELQKKTE